MRFVHFRTKIPRRLNCLHRQRVPRLPKDRACILSGLSITGAFIEGGWNRRRVEVWRPVRAAQLVCVHPSLSPAVTRNCRRKSLQDVSLSSHTFLSTRRRALASVCIYSCAIFRVLTVSTCQNGSWHHPAGIRPISAAQPNQQRPQP